MDSIDYGKVIANCLVSARKELGKSWKKFKPFADHEFRQFAESLEFLAKLRRDGIIDDEELKVRMGIQRLALNNVILAVEGVGAVTAQNVVNAIIKIVRAAVTKTVAVVLPEA